METKLPILDCQGKHLYSVDIYIDEVTLTFHDCKKIICVNGPRAGYTCVLVRYNNIDVSDYDEFNLEVSSVIQTASVDDRGDFSTWVVVYSLLLENNRYLSIEFTSLSHLDSFPNHFSIIE